MSVSVITMSSRESASLDQATTYSGPCSPSRTWCVCRVRLIRPASEGLILHDGALRGFGLVCTGRGGRRPASRGDQLDIVGALNAGTYVQGNYSEYGPTAIAPISEPSTIVLLVLCLSASGSGRTRMPVSISDSSRSTSTHLGSLKFGRLEGAGSISAVRL